MPSEEVRDVGFVIRVGSGDSVEEVAAEHGVDEESVRKAVEWVVANEDEVREIIGERAKSLGGLEREYPSGVDPPREADAADYSERQLEALDAVVERFA